MDEMHIETVDLGDELVEPIQCRLAATPVIVLGPVAAHILDPGERGALTPVIHQLGFGPACVAQARLQIYERIGGDGDAIRSDISSHDRP